MVVAAPESKKAKKPAKKAPKKVAKAGKKPAKAAKKEAKDKDKITLSAMDLIAKKYGSEAVQSGGGTRFGKYQTFSTGSFGLDKATGIGGLPRGRIIEIYGVESSGKSTITMHAMANAQRAGFKVAYIDAEHGFDPKYADAIGVDLEAMVFSQPDYGEQALDVVQIMAESKEFGLIVVDSVAALTPKAEIDGDIGDSHLGLHARLMSQSMRKVVSVAAKTGTCIIFVNQIRMKIGVLWGSPETTTGGNALKFYASMRLDVRRKAPVKEGEIAVATETKVRIVKNKCAAPYGEALFDIRYGHGIDSAAEVLSAAVEEGVVEKSGSWFIFPDGSREQGLGRACEMLRGNLELLEDLWARLLPTTTVFSNAETAKKV